MRLDQHLAVVVTNEKDPDKEFGIEVRCESLTDGEVVPVIFKPMFPPGYVKVPDIGQIVKVFVLSNDREEDEEEDRGTIDFPDFAYYDHRVIDVNKGKLPADFSTNYPKRCGWWNKDGSLFYFDETDGNKEYIVKIDANNFIQITDSKITVDQNGTKIELENGTMTTTVSTTEMGASGATHPIPLGDILKTYLETVQSGFGATHTHSFAGTVTNAIPAAAGPVTCAGTTGVPSPIMPTVPSDLNSTKHFTDQ